MFQDFTQSFLSGLRSGADNAISFLLRDRQLDQQERELELREKEARLEEQQREAETGAQAARALGLVQGTEGPGAAQGAAPTGAQTESLRQALAIAANAGAQGRINEALAAAVPIELEARQAQQLEADFEALMEGADERVRPVVDLAIRATRAGVAPSVTNTLIEEGIKDLELSDREERQQQIEDLTVSIRQAELQVTRARLAQDVAEFNAAERDRQQRMTAANRMRQRLLSRGLTAFADLPDEELVEFGARALEREQVREEDRENLAEDMLSTIMSRVFFDPNASLEGRDPIVFVPPDEAIAQTERAMQTLVDPSFSFTPEEEEALNASAVLHSEVAAVAAQAPKTGKAAREIGAWLAESIGQADRAEAVLRAVLRAQGFSEEQIEAGVTGIREGSEGG